jgi:hypothetical protein
VSKCDLRIDWATHAAAKYACEHWHYSRCTPKFKQVWIGVWEDERFIGIVAFGRSSTPYLGDAFGLKTTECCELTRVALTAHKSPVSRIVSLALMFLKKQSPGMRLVVSLADSLQGHHGGIYQAGNWIYIGRSSEMQQFYFRGKWRNDSSLMRYLQVNPAAKSVLKKRKVPGKHKYLMPLDSDMRKRISTLSKPYPKRAQGDTKDTPGNLPGEGGSTPTCALHSSPLKSSKNKK